MQTFQDDIMKLKILIREMEEKFQLKISELEKKIESLEQNIQELNQTKNNK